jgi:hypothetical protein
MATVDERLRPSTSGPAVVDDQADLAMGLGLGPRGRVSFGEDTGAGLPHPLQPRIRPRPLSRGDKTFASLTMTSRTGFAMLRSHTRLRFM